MFLIKFIDLLGLTSDFKGIKDQFVFIINGNILEVWLTAENWVGAGGGSPSVSRDRRPDISICVKVHLIREFCCALDLTLYNQFHMKSQENGVDLWQYVNYGLH